MQTMTVVITGAPWQLDAIKKIIEDAAGQRSAESVPVTVTSERVPVRDATRRPERRR